MARENSCINSLLQMHINTKICPLYLVATNGHLRGIYWEKQNIPMVTENDRAAFTILKKTAGQLEEYFEGKRKKFDLPLHMEGTDFQKKVWQALANIPYGETRSYKEVAMAVQNDKAFRAVGTANGQNPICIIIPCHRVIAADGSIGGFAGGLAIKEKLLKLEQCGVN